MMVMVDADKDGSISYGEFASFAQERFVLPLPPARTAKVLKFELNTTMRDLHATNREKELRELFDEIDLNGNGLIEANEIRIALEKIGT
jgi:Ca2+-binding EF-hand superfamily protein